MLRHEAISHLEKALLRIRWKDLSYEDSADRTTISVEIQDEVEVQKEENNPSANLEDAGMR